MSVSNRPRELDIPYRPVVPSAVLLGLLLAADVALCLRWPLVVQLVGAVILFCFLPGSVTLPFFLSRREPHGPLGWLALSGGLSYALSSLLTMLVHLWPGEMHLWQLLSAMNAFVIVMWLVALVHARPLFPSRHSAGFGRGTYLSLFVLMALAFYLRFAFLGYAEFQGDEIGVARVARSAIAGQDDVLLLQMKGPTQYLITMAFALFSDGFNELALRTPFALASVLTVAAVFLVGGRLLNGRVGVAAAALLLIEGFAAAHARTVQYQYIVLLMRVLAVYCLSRFLEAQDGPRGGRFLALGIFFWGFGLLTHYDALLLLPVFAVAYLRKYGWRWPSGGRRPVTLSVLFTLVVLGAFYVPFVLHPQFATTYAIYSGKKVGVGPFNNLPDFLETALFYNGAYYMAVMAVLTAAGWTGGLRQALSSRYAAYLVSALCAAGFIVAVAAPSLPALGDKSWAFLFFLPALAGFSLSRKLDARVQTLFVWFWVVFFVKAFVERAPGLHYYVFSPAWALIAATGLDCLLDRSGCPFSDRRAATGARPLASPLRIIVAALLVSLYGVLAFYHYLFYVHHDPEYALRFPAVRHPLYWTPQRERPDAPFFGFPHKAGWKTIGYLYATGELRGQYKTNGRFPWPKWYTRELPDPDEIPRYFFFDEESHLLKPLPNYSKSAVEHFYALTGEVLVGGEPRLLIYEDRRLLDGPPEVVRYRSEDYEAAYDRLFSLGMQRLLARHDDNAEVDRDLKLVAQYLERAAGERDALFVASQELGVLLNYYYQGDLPVSLLDDAPGDGVREEGRIEGEDGRAYVLSCEGGGDEDPSAERGPDGTYHRLGVLGLALLPPTSSSVGLSTATLGGKVALVGYQAGPADLRPGEDLRVTLFWRALAALEEDYTVFVHFVDAGGAGEIYAQQDNPPARGGRPTSTWAGDEIVEDRYVLRMPVDIPPGSYRVEIGMYDLQTMERLSVDGTGADRFVLPLTFTAEGR